MPWFEPNCVFRPNLCEAVSESAREPNIKSQIANATPKFLSKCFFSVEWWIWCCPGEIKIRSIIFGYLILMWEWRKFDPNEWNITTPALAPKMVTKSTLLPNKKINTEITTPWTIDVRSMNITPSIGWVRNIVNGVMVSALWWTWWNAQRKGTLCIKRCTKNLEKSSNMKKNAVNKIATILAEAAWNARGWMSVWLCKRSYRSVEIVNWLIKSSRHRPIVRAWAWASWCTWKKQVTNREKSRKTQTNEKRNRY